MAPRVEQVRKQRRERARLKVHHLHARAIWRRAHCSEAGAHRPVPVVTGEQRVVVAGDRRKSVLSRKGVAHHHREGQRVASEERAGAGGRVDGALGLEGAQEATVLLVECALLVVTLAVLAVALPSPSLHSAGSGCSRAGGVASKRTPGWRVARCGAGGGEAMVTRASSMACMRSRSALLKSCCWRNICISSLSVGAPPRTSGEPDMVDSKFLNSSERPDTRDDPSCRR